MCCVTGNYMEIYNAKKEWSKNFSNQNNIFFPAEYVIRIFKGKYPKLNFQKKSFLDKKICDVGCGDGRNLVLLSTCGFKIHGIEISDELTAKIKSKMNNMKIKCDIKVGNNSNIPYKKSFFDFLLSWNSCYYMDNNLAFEKVVKEFARVLKKDGYLILSIPKKTCFIYQNSKEVKKGYRMIMNDPFKVRNGQIMRYFKNENEIKNSFSKYFKNFIFASIEDDCFGLNYHWHLLVCQKKSG